MVTVALIVALGGFLMGFDASVISGVVGFIETEFSLTKIQLGWSVSSLALTATFAMMVSGPLSDRVGRRPVLRVAALLFGISAIASALAPNFFWLVSARMLGGLGVGAALIIAPMYIAEMAPPKYRGRLVSFNQLNIVIGISAAFFSNYLLLTLGAMGRSPAPGRMELALDARHRDIAGYPVPGRATVRTRKSALACDARPGRRGSGSPRACQQRAAGSRGSAFRQEEHRG
jgi:MFS family permease